MTEILNSNLFAHPATNCRARVEAAMLETIQRLQDEGLPLNDIALSMADASEDYVIFLARKKIAPRAIV